ncbi:SAM-dependent methyltransferase [Streptomyces sp. NBC_00320]|uniref:class I SAM-dependent methyltransferase n=1 Tax=unclassified Streptomyces TaxID=2593676 RepID=UPI002259FC81|nr:SAM-dependent methyltransferase [Streptomyces sp. NBC_00320]MCX5150875.1 SAM-dependent methyltransferase [Streptomyces sp. NBC_00320]
MPSKMDAVERTALLTAALRAAETKRPDRLYEDPYAALLAGDIGPQLLAEILAVTYPEDGERVVPSTPDYNAIRTRFFDGFLQHAARRPGMRQIVLAPSGMDSRAYRLEWPDGMTYFEVDRPAVLEYKKSRLGDVQPRVDHRTVAVDLTSDTWEDDLQAAGYDPALPSTWLLEGLLYYIPEAETHRVLDRVAALMTPGSMIAADICGAAALRVPDMQPLLDVFAGWGCRMVFGDDEPEELFDKHGFTVEAVQPGTAETAEYGRWTDAVPPRTAKDVRRFFYIHGKRR